VTYSLLKHPESRRPNREVLAEAEHFVHAALDGLSAHIAILDEAGLIIHVNKAWREFGDQNSFKDTAYGVGVNYLAVCDRARDAKDAAIVAQGIRDVMLHKTSEFYLEYPCNSPTEKRWYVVRVTRFSWYGHIRLIVAHQNVTDTKRIEVELQNSKRRLEAILDNLVDGIITFDQNGSIESVNPAAAYIFGYQSGEMIGLPVQQLVADLEADQRDGDVSDFMARLGALGDELTGRRKEGQTFAMYFAVSQFDMDDQPLFSAIIQDFTERKYLEAQLWEKERLNIALDKERELRDLKNRFISMMSHDLKTPLAAIRLANSLLRTYGDRATAAEKQESYDTIESQVNYLSELISDVMTISRSDFSGTRLEAEVVDLETYCRDIIEELQLAYKMQCCLNFSGTGQRVEAMLDKKLMRRALTNLLINAIKYSPAGSPVDVELVCEGGEAVIQVRDHGMGIPEADQKRLFEPFHRAANVGSIQGTGLGLAIAKQAVDLHNGSIAVESQVGAGTTFIVRLPLIQRLNDR
jgi:PAS domain S-box-containing protein